MKTPLLFFVVLMLSFSLGRSHAQCALEGYTYLGSYNGHVYLVSSAAAQWPDANTAANATGGYLVAINDAGENTFVATALGGDGALAWIGLNDVASENTFVWTNGDSYSYNSWGAGEPNNGLYCDEDEDYVEINRNGFGAWNDLPNTVCGDPIVRVWVVELDTDSDSDCDGVTDICDRCDGGDDSGPCNATSFPGFEDIPSDWVCGNGSHKVYMCHEGTTICIDYHAVQAHLDHGDFLGPCTGCTDARSFESSSSLNMEVYPNPVDQKLNIALQGLTQDAIINMYDGVGQLIYTQNIKADQNHFSLDVSRFAPGTHIVKVIVGKESMMQRVMIVR